MDNNNDHGKPFSHPADPHGAKAHFDANEQKFHSTGVPGLWRQITNLLILVGIIGVILVISRFL
ncbi:MULTISPECIES: hypothetical protein [Paenibacillus]|jgi:hypothetical protein|uniref:Uncharacterized protein n=2 Tax=Paenibacillus barengoltzii TaxID=343517 RepID=R9L498_9BACL|nr:MULTISPECIES: hypothetical protein [Paenibacillus]EOS53500.1 hypothetical protein C812_04051 [Paenibacillus barengoltzii G22]MDU0330854.1 hypothetical protein [Paenibacillus sp. 3LSP]MEC2344737.1 hypothetical protein [Paenibacillus barengoltzii]SMF15431.1 hypothetical protein SAMN02744124_01586 [Paenibacillus barengoltzii J12]SMF22300.1 hypothetical protein SAMN02744102_02050 [Paenibacillus barengoltzii]